MSHTPGPWYVADGRYYMTRVVAGAHPHVRAVAHVKEGFGPDELMPNAHLMAAGPELLDLARAVAAHFEGTDAPLGQQARDVLVKVEGRS